MMNELSGIRTEEKQNNEKCKRKKKKGNEKNIFLFMIVMLGRPSRGVVVSGK